MSKKFRVVTWNIERGIKLDNVAKILRNDIPADIYALQEVDIYARRSSCRDVASELSSALGLPCGFGKEFRELAQEGCGGKRAFHGQAFLSRFPTFRSEPFYFPHQLRDWTSRWYHKPLIASGAPRLQAALIQNVGSVELGHAVAHTFQPREGGRMALFGEFTIGNRTLFIYNTHLESHATDEERALQVGDIVEHASLNIKKGEPMIILGDLNNKREAASPVIAVARKHGFYDALRQFEGAGTPTSHDGYRLDWILAKNIRPISGFTFQRGFDASDHLPVVAEFEL